MSDETFKLRVESERYRRALEGILDVCRSATVRDVDLAREERIATIALRALGEQATTTTQVRTPYGLASITHPEGTVVQLVGGSLVVSRSSEQRPIVMVTGIPEESQ